MDDLLIRGGHVIDGSGGPGRDADVAVREGRIAAIEARSARSAHRVIDARGQVVAPGFIDIHTHSDFTLPLNPSAESQDPPGRDASRSSATAASRWRRRCPARRRCSASTSPRARPGCRSRRRRSPTTSAGFPPTSVNVILQVGHNTLRLMTAGMENRPLTAGRAGHDGAPARGGARRPAPGVCRPASSPRPATSRTPPRSTPSRACSGAAAPPTRRTSATRPTACFEAVREAIAVAEPTGVHVQIAHLKLSGVDNWGGAGGCSARSRPRAAAGSRSTATPYPYDTATNPLRNLLPALGDGRRHPAMLERLGRRDVRTRIRDEVARNGLTNFGRIPSWDVGAHRDLAGPARATPAAPSARSRASRGVDAIDAVCDYLIADRGADAHRRSRRCRTPTCARSRGAPWVTGRLRRQRAGAPPA